MESVLLNRLLSGLLKVLKKVLLSLKNKGEWRRKWAVDSVPWPQLHKGLIESWKLCLNLCFLKLLKPIWSHVISLTPLGLWQLWIELGAGLLKWRIFFLNTDKLSELRKSRSSLFHSEIVEVENEFLKKCFTLKMGMLCTYLEVWDECLTGIKWNRYWGCSSLKTL